MSVLGATKSVSVNRHVFVGEPVFSGEFCDAKPTFAEYLAKRERALDLLDHWRRNDLHQKHKPLSLMTLAIALSDRHMPRMSGIPPRDKTPLPLP
jgi:hypothetical protein